MLILHISDIHFKSPECLDSFTDQHSAIRTRMMLDLVKQTDTLGKVDAILIGGDIAFKAATDEYDTALVWIQQLAEVSGCSKERIFVVPGNHDVDRGKIKGSVPAQNVQHAIVSAKPENREWKLRQQLGDPASGQALLDAHGEYNEFAARFGCNVWPGKPFWHQDIPLDGGVTLRLYGLTTTLLSGQNGADDKPGGLYLSPLQTVLDPVPNTANLVLMHHPLDWLADGEAVDDDLTSRAMFHLFGHKHKQRAILESRYVRLGAGAVNPSRSEQPYLPGYNLMNLQVQGTGGDRVIKVALHQRRMQDNPELFAPIKNHLDEEVFTTTIAIPEVAPLPVALAKQGKASATPIGPVVHGAGAVDGGNKPGTTAEDAESAMGEENTRDVLYRFWLLSSSQRRGIAQKLGLLEDGEMKLPEPERYGRALIRAGQRAIMNEVAAEVAKLEN